MSSVCISPDSHKVLCTTAAGNLGYLDIQSRDYNTLMRSHEDSVLAFSVEGIWKQMATVSQDNTIRVWDLVSMQQVGETRVSRCLTFINSLPILCSVWLSKLHSSRALKYPP